MSDSRLRRSADIRAVLSTRALAHGRAAVVHVRRRGDDRPARWTVVAGRRVGSATRRNRAKRRLRAALRRRALPTGVDLVVVAAPEAVDTAYEPLERELERLIRRAVTADRERPIARVGTPGREVRR
jgi:ribonuclease P protein component